MITVPPQTDLQRSYYARTALQYEELHVRENDEHGRALAWLAGLAAHYGARSVLDVGCGTGRARAHWRGSIATCLVSRE